MKIKNWRRFPLFLFICFFCLAHLYVETPANAQYPIQSYYQYSTSTVDPSYLYNTTYLNNYSWSSTDYFDRKLVIPTPVINEWTVHPAFGNIVYSATTSGDTLTIHGVYFSAHTHGGVNFNRTLSLGSSLFSMPSYIQPNQTMYTNIGGQSSYMSPMNYYVRQVLQFSPVLHGPLLNN